MISPLLQSFIDAPLANAVKTHVPGGRAPVVRAKKSDASDDIGGPKLTHKQLRALKDKAAAAKRTELFDYYGKTSLEPEAVATHMGLFRMAKVGFDKDGKTIMERVLDVELAARELAWRRKAA